ncbi:hypothetical protein GCM10027421_35970 [Microbacterium shaanxiense]
MVSDSVVWSDLAGRLVAAFRVVSDRVFLIVSSRENSRLYVQFAGRADALYAEAAGPEFVPDADATRLESLGWERPTSGQPNWSFVLPLPALTSEYSALAERCVVALRDVFGVTDPGQLIYRAWREAEAFPQGVTLYPEQIEALDKGEDPLEMAQLGLPAAS